MRDVVISAENIWKEYRLGALSHHSLAMDLQSWWAKCRGKEDPNSKIAVDGSAADRGGEERFLALQDVSFEIKRGDLVGIIGRNGAGKSTLLKILSRVTTPTRGQITIKGRVASLLEVGTGFHPELTGRENVFLNGAIMGMSKDEIRRKFDEIVAFSEVEKFIDTPVKRYSSGMYVRLAFGVAAHLEPEILIVDEVLAVGDAQFQKKCLGKMEDVGKDGRTVLFVSHNMPAVQRLCTLGILLEAGQLAMSGQVPEVINSYLASGGDEIFCWQRNSAPSTDAFLERLYLQDGHGNLAAYVETGSALKVAVEFMMAKPFNNLEIGVCLLDEYGTQIFGSAPQDDGLDVKGMEGRYRAVVKFPEGLLLPKSYSIKVILWTTTDGLLDSVDSIRFTPQETISLANKNSGGRTGMVAVACNWNIEAMQ